MLAYVFFFGLFAAGFAKESIFREVYSDFEILENLTEEGKEKVLQTLVNVVKHPNEYEKYVEERMNSLLWECVVQEQKLNKSIAEGVFKGMLNNKKFTNFQCISNNARDTLNKLVQIKTQIPVNSQNLMEKGLSEIAPFNMTFSSFFSYIQDLYKRKKEEMEKTDNEASRKKVLEEVLKKMKNLDAIMEQINTLLKTNRFKFIEDYIYFAFTTETNLRNIQREGAQKIMKCVA